MNMTDSEINFLNVLLLFSVMEYIPTEKTK